MKWNESKAQRKKTLKKTIYMQTDQKLIEKKQQQTRLMKQQAKWRKSFFLIQKLMKWKRHRHIYCCCLFDVMRYNFVFFDGFPMIIIIIIIIISCIWKKNLLETWIWKRQQTRWWSPSSSSSCWWWSSSIFDDLCVCVCMIQWFDDDDDDDPGAFYCRENKIKTKKKWQSTKWRLSRILIDVEKKLIFCCWFQTNNQSIDA